MPRISIIVPVYNVQEYIEKCLESLIKQTFTDIEIIVVDDGSPDESYKIYEKYASIDKRIKIIKKENAGVSEARNTGIENALGEFLMFIDSDDWMELNGCELLYGEYLRTGADLVLGDVYTVTNEKRYLKRVFGKEFTTKDQNFIRSYERACLGYGYNPLPINQRMVSGLGSPWNKLFKKSLIDKYHLRFDPYVKGIYDDNLFVLNYLEKVKKVSYIAKPIYDYRIVQNSITKAYKADTLNISRRIFGRIEDFIARQDEPDYFRPGYYMYVIRRLSAELSVYYFAKTNNESRIESFKKLKKIMKTEPYVTAIKEVEVDRLMLAHKMTWIMARLNWAFGMWIMFKVRTLVKQCIKM